MKTGKYAVLMKCGHSEVKVIEGNKEAVQEKIKQLGERECSKCRLGGTTDDGYELKRIPYHEYKDDYNHCKTEKGSYDEDTETICVYVKKKGR